MKKEKRVKKEYCYKTSDDRTFTGPKAEDKAKSHERGIIFRESKKEIVAKARKLFNTPIPKSDKWGDYEDKRSQREIDLIEELTNIVYQDQDFHYLDDFVELMMDLIELNPRAMKLLTKFILSQKEKTDMIEDAILL